MLREPPLNYIISLVLIAFIWMITAFGIFSWLEDNIDVGNLPVVDFIAYIRILISLGGLLPIIASFIWYYLGEKPSYAKDVQKAKRIWLFMFFAHIAESFILTLITFIYLMIKGEQIGLIDYVIIYLSFALQTFFAFWLVTFLFSPVNVKYIPLFKK
jgi:hypothetical protein